jgi:hypothetical protein
VVFPSSEWVFPSPKGPVKGGEEDGQEHRRQRAEESGAKAAIQPVVVEGASE